MVYYMFVTSSAFMDYLICGSSSAIHPYNPVVVIGFGTARTEARGPDY